MGVSLGLLSLNCQNLTECVQKFSPTYEKMALSAWYSHKQTMKTRNIFKSKCENIKLDEIFRKMNLNTRLKGSKGINNFNSCFYSLVLTRCWPETVQSLY